MLKIQLLRLFQMNQQMAEIPIRILPSFTLPTPFNHFPNILVILVGGGRLYVKKTTCHKIFAKGHERNKCSIVSTSSQNQHFLHPFQFLLARLSLVNKILLYRNHIKILIFIGIFIFHKYFVGKRGCSFIRSSYMDLTENTPFSVSFHMNLS